MPYPPAFADPNTAGSRILGGVNYASAAAGILDESGQHYVIHLQMCISIVKQIEQLASDDLKLNFT